MTWAKWSELPEQMRISEVRLYYERLERKKRSLAVKRVFDFSAALFLLIVLFPVMGVLAVLIKCDSRGSIIFCQERITQYGKKFQIYKFRTMVENAEEIGTQVTLAKDARVTGIGRTLRKYRLDELPQLVNILKGEMTFVGTRPEVPKYVEKYHKNMLATLLLPAGVTSAASIRYKDEEEILRSKGDAEDIYLHQILPEKMIWNLKYLRNFSLMADLRILTETVTAVLKG